MKRLKKYSVLCMGLVMIVLVVSFAIVLPDIFMKWQEEQENGKTSHMNLEYQSYSVSEFNSIEEELEMMATILNESAVMNSVEIDIVKLNESKEELLLILNQELDNMYGQGLMPLNIQVTSFREISYCQYEPHYDFDVTSDDSRTYGIRSKKGVSFKYLELLCDWDGGTIQLKFDDNFHKILAVNLEVQSPDFDVMQEWTNKFHENIMEDTWASDRWAAYLGYTAGKTDSYLNMAQDDIDEVRYYSIFLPSGQEMMAKSLAVMNEEENYFTWMIGVGYFF